MRSGTSTARTYLGITLDLDVDDAAVLLLALGLDLFSEDLVPVPLGLAAQHLVSTRRHADSTSLTPRV
jgi:hypothetical protein